MKKIIVIFILLSLMISILSANDRLKLKIGIMENPPKTFTAENGEICGFWADIMNYISDEEEWEIEWVHGYWDECLQRLEKNEIDILVDTGFTEPRSKKFAFSNETVLLSWTRLYTSKDSNINSILDLEGKKIAGLKGSFNLNGPGGLRDIIQRFEINCTIIEMDDYIKVFEALENKEIDAGITNKDFGHLHENNYDVERTPIIFQPARMLFAFSKNSDQTPFLIGRIDHHIKELKKDKNSIYYRSLDRYLGGVEKITVFPSWINWILIAALMIIVLFMGVNYLLKRKVKEKTLELEKDIAERKKAEEAMKESEKQLQTLIDAMPDFVCFKDGDGRWLKVNDAGIRIFQLEGLDYLGKKDSELAELSSKLRGAFLTCKESDARAWKEGGFIRGEETIPYPDGSVRVFDVTKVSVSHLGGERKGLVIIGHDITERRQVEEELAKHREHLEELIKERTGELEEKNKKLEEFNELFVNREFRIKELKDKVKELEGKK